MAQCVIITILKLRIREKSSIFITGLQDSDVHQRQLRVGDR
jgi:hypothetical protein